MSKDKKDHKCLCVLLVDVSGSMGGEPINEVNKGLQNFVKAIKDDSQLSQQLEVCLMKYTTTVTTVQEPALVTDAGFTIPTLVASGGTDTVLAVRRAIAKVESRVTTYEEEKQPFHCPWIILMTDGDISSSGAVDLSATIKDDTSERKYIFQAIGVEGASMTDLKKISSPGMPAVSLDGTKFVAFFEWLKSSMSKIANAKGGESVSLKDGSERWKKPSDGEVEFLVKVEKPSSASDRKAGIRISGNKTVRTIQTDFTRKFPFLRLHIFPESEKEKQTQTPFGPDTKIEDVRKEGTEGVISINGNKLVKTIEREFETAFGLYAQVCYINKDGKRYYTTDEYDALSLSKLNKEGESLEWISGIKIQVTDAEKREMLNYFWKTIQLQLGILGYEFETKDFSPNVEKFYANPDKRHQWWGLQFPVYKMPNGEDVLFRIEMWDEYFYGFYRPQRNHVNNEIVEIVNELSETFKTVSGWYGYKFSDNYDLNFWRFNTAEMLNLKDKTKRGLVIMNVATEMDMYIKKYIAAVNQNKEDDSAQLNMDQDEFEKQVPDRPKPSSGDVQILLSWNNYNDLDLYCVDPSGTTIYYGNKLSPSGGQLEIDMNAGSSRSNEPIEHIYWPKGKAPAGQYQVFLNHCSIKDSVDATPYKVSIKYGKKSEVYTGTIRNNDGKRRICGFNYIP